MTELQNFKKNKEASISDRIAAHSISSVEGQAFALRADAKPTIGLIGGMGSRATIDTYTQLILKLEEHHRHILIENLPIENVFEHLSDDVFSIIQSAIQRFSRSGVRVIGIPCNTVHCYGHKIQEECEQAGIKFVSLVDSTVLKAREIKAKCVSILATPTGVELYKTAFEAASISTITPSSLEQEIINSVIKNVLNENINGNLRADELSLRALASNHFDKGADTILLGCTELPIAFGHKIPNHYISTISVLADNLAHQSMEN